MSNKHNEDAASKAGQKHSLPLSCQQTKTDFLAGSISNQLYPVNPSGEPWGRLPKPKARLWGLSRTTILEMCLRGEVKSTVIKKRHAVRGIRLIDMASLAEALNRLAANQGGGSSDA